MLARLKFDITELVNEILDHIPEDVIINGTVLDPAIGGGQFVREIERRKRKAGKTDQEIRNTVYGYEENILRRDYAVNKYDLKGNYIVDNFLERDFKDMKFDVVLMNPPYLKRTWIKFVEKAVELSNFHIATVNPDPTDNVSEFGSSWKKLLIDNGVQKRINVTNYFPNVNSGRISTFIMDKTKNANLSSIEPDDKTLVSLLEKTLIEKPNSFVYRGSQQVQYCDHKEIPDNQFTEPSILSCTKEKLIIEYSEKKNCPELPKHKEKIKGRFIIINRFFGKNNPDPFFVISDMEKYHLGYSCMAFKLDDTDTEEGFSSVYSSKLYRKLLEIMRNGGFDNTQGNFMRLKKLDLSKTWTDKEIYQHFDLSNDEIKYIEGQ